LYATEDFNTTQLFFLEFRGGANDIGNRSRGGYVYWYG